MFPFVPVSPAWLGLIISNTINVLTTGAPVWKVYSKVSGAERQGTVVKYLLFKICLFPGRLCEEENHSLVAMLLKQSVGEVGSRLPTLALLPAQHPPTHTHTTLL